MAYRWTHMGALVKGDPREARREIARALRKHGGDAVKAAEDLGIARRTLDRFVVALGMSDTVSRIRTKANGTGKNS